MLVNEEIIKWQSNNNAEIFVSKEYFHHHAFEILNTHTKLRDGFKESLNTNISIAPRIKRTKEKSAKGIKADNLNKELRKILSSSISDVKFEVSEEKGVFYFSAEKSSIGGFDFAILNHKKNLTALRNLCFGELHYHDGIKRWNKYIEKNQDLAYIANSLINSDDIGKDVEYSELEIGAPLVVGEIQFGNWALAYRDFFKVLKANVQNSIDCLIYVVPTGNLESMLSDGIVTYDKTVKILKEFEKVISVPIWVVGLEIK